MPDTLDSQDRLDVAGSWRHILATVDAVPEDVTIAVSLVHVESGERRGHPGDRSFRAASTIKVLVLIALARALDAGTLDLANRIVPAPHTRVGGSSVLNRLSDHLAPTIADHAWLMTAISDNIASNVLIDAVGLPAIRAMAHELGLAETVLHRHFMNEKRPDEPSNSVSAADLTAMLAAIATDRAASPSGASGCGRCSATSSTATASPGTCPPESTTRERRAGSATSSTIAACSRDPAARSRWRSSPTGVPNRTPPTS